MQSDQPAGTTAAGWYPDPVDDHDLRYFNGTQWTGDVSTNGERFVAPLVPPHRTPAARTGALALTAGVVALSLAWIPFICVIGAALAIVAIVAGVRSRNDPLNASKARAGIATGATALLVAAGGLWASALILGAVDDFENPGEYETTLDECVEVDDVTRAIGTITNLSDVERDYTITVDFIEGQGEQTEVDGVEAGASASFVVEENLRFDDLSCAVVSVTGPLPFGVDVSN